MNRIEQTLEYLNKKFNESTYFQTHLYEKKYRYEHTIRVANIGKVIAISEGFDVEAMVVACLLHDISYCEEFNSRDAWLSHGRRAVEIAKEFIKSLGFETQVEQDILYGIAIHVDDVSDFEGERTSFALSIGDADNIDRFDAYRIYETLKNDKFEDLSIDEQIESCSKRITSLDKYLNMTFANKTATEMLHEKMEFQKLFYQKLKMQLENSKQI